MPGKNTFFFKMFFVVDIGYRMLPVESSGHCDACVEPEAFASGASGDEF